MESCTLIPLITEMKITQKTLIKIKQNISGDCIIHLSGPSALKTPIELLHSKSVIAVNGSAGYLMKNNIKLFAYIVCDGSFYGNNKKAFHKYSRYANHTFISEDVINHATPKEKETLLNSCFVLKSICKSRGGPGRKLRYFIKQAINKDIFIKCSTSRRAKTIAFSTNVAHGHFGSATVAFSALQIAISLNFDRVFMSGLDLVGACPRFYNEKQIQPTNLPLDFEYILESFAFMKERYHCHAFNLSTETSIPYEILPFMDPHKLMDQF